MILGFGNDIIDIRRVERTIERYGDRFLSRVFTDIERRKSDGRAGRAASYAKRFAAKEACAKALGTGFRQGVFWRDMGVVNLPSGRPTLELTGGALQALAEPYARGSRSAHRPHHHRRLSHGSGDRHHLGLSRPHARLSHLPPKVGRAIGAADGSPHRPACRGELPHER